MVSTLFTISMYIWSLWLKYRRKVFTKQILDDMQTIFEEVCSKFEAELVAFDGESDHVHLLVVYPPKVAISGLVNSLKGVSGRLLRKKYPSIKAEFFWVNFLHKSGICLGEFLRFYGLKKI